MATTTTERDGTPVLLTKRQTARMLGLGISTLEKYRALGWMPAPVVVGTALRWRVGDLTDWISMGCPRRGQ